MAKKTLPIKPEHKKIEKLFDGLSIKHSPWELWSDIISMIAISISNSCDVNATRRDSREKAFENIYNKYNKKDMDVILDIFAEIFYGLTTNSEQDMLGELYMGLGLNSHCRGQFFTPYHISHMMAKMTTVETDLQKVISEKGYATVCDPCCGAGVMLIAAWNVMRENGLKAEEILLFGQDIDTVTALMCYVQLSVLGAPAIIGIGDSLQEIKSEDYENDMECWITPALSTNTWFNRRFKIPDERDGTNG